MAVPPSADNEDMLVESDMSAVNEDMLVESDIPSFLAYHRIEDLPGGSGGIPMEDYKCELCQAVFASSVTILDAATATGQLLDPIAGQK